MSYTDAVRGFSGRLSGRVAAVLRERIEVPMAEVGRRLDAVNPLLRPLLRDQASLKLLEGEFRFSEETINQAVQTLTRGNDRVRGLKVKVCEDGVALTAELTVYGEPTHVDATVSFRRAELNRSEAVVDFAFVGPIEVKIGSTHNHLDGNLPGLFLRRMLNRKDSARGPVVESLEEPVMRVNLHRIDAVAGALQSELKGLSPFEVVHIPAIRHGDGVLTVQVNFTPGAGARVLETVGRVLQEQASRLRDEARMQLREKGVGGIVRELSAGLRERLPVRA